MAHAVALALGTAWVGHFGEGGKQDSKGHVATSKRESRLHTTATSPRRRSRPGRYGRTEWPCLRASVPFIVAQDCGLVAARLLRKQPDRQDARQVQLVLPPACRAALERLAPLQCRTNDALFAGLDAAEFSALHRVLRKLARPQEDAA